MYVILIILLNVFPMKGEKCISRVYLNISNVRFNHFKSPTFISVQAFSRIAPLESLCAYKGRKRKYKKNDLRV